MRTEINPFNGEVVVIFPGKLLTLPQEAALTNVNEKNYGFGLAEIDMGEDGKTSVDVMVYEKPLMAGSFRVGDDVEVRVQTEGAYAGNAELQLPARKTVSLDILAKIVKNNPTTAATTATKKDVQITE